jgi:protein tyrosine/serine phosphatase
VYAEIANGTFTPAPDLPAPDPAVLAVFRGFVTDAQARTGTATVLRRAATGEMPLVMHDSSGTYRTGWVSAVLLAALGVDMAQIVDDFVLSDEALGAKFAFPEYLKAGFDQARTTYGSFSNFLIGGLGMGGNALPSLRRRLLG